MRMTGDVAMLRQILVPAVLDSASRLLLLTGMLALMFAIIMTSIAGRMIRSPIKAAHA